MMSISQMILAEALPKCSVQMSFTIGNRLLVDGVAGQLSDWTIG